MLDKTITNSCPAGFCEYIQEYSVHLIIVLCIDIFIFLVTLVPPLFNWSTKKPDGKKRIYFAALACITFYFWLIFLAINTLYCFGFAAHLGPCVNVTRFKATETTPNETEVVASNLPISLDEVDSQENNDNAVPSSSFITETTSRFKRHTLESSLEQPPNTLPPLSLPTLSSSLSSFPFTSGSLSSYMPHINRLSSSSSTGNSPTINIRDIIAKAPTNSTSVHSSLTTLLASARHRMPSPSALTSSPTLKFTPTNNKLSSNLGDDGAFSSYGIVAQALVDEKIDCETTNTTEAPDPAKVEHETELRNLFYAHILIVVVLFVVIIANAKEGKPVFIYFIYF